jgi:hypothetical protein
MRQVVVLRVRLDLSVLFCIFPCIYFGIHIMYVCDYLIMTNAIIVYYYTSFIGNVIVTRVDDERSDECSNKTSVTVCLIKQV